jgi:hypothetical protein
LEVKGPEALRARFVENVVAWGDVIFAAIKIKTPLVVAV